MIIRTKLHIPYARHNAVLSRPRLMRMLDEGMEAKLTLLSAQAGYGKTTVLSEWVKHSHSHVLVAWVSLDKQDNDWLRFWRYVIASIQGKAPAFGTAITVLLEQGPSALPENAIQALLNELDQLDGDLVLVLDDYHVIEQPAIHHSLTYLIEHLPKHIHLFIASRTELPIPTARLLAKGEFRRISTEDLRFHLDEGISYFRNTTALGLTEKQIAWLHSQSEGWISGLQLAAISLKRSANVEESIQQFSGQQRPIFDYLLEEVFDNQSEPMREFLLETSILSRMNRSLCQAVTGQEQSEEHLERLEQLNLFIIPLDSHRDWYRYHHLLSDFLQHLLIRTNPEKWLQSHIRAAGWLEIHGLDEEAIEHYIDGKQVADAVRLIEKNLLKLVQSKSVALNRWVTALPDNSFEEKPMIELFYISVLLGVGEWDTAFHRVQQAEARFHAMQGKLTQAEWKQAMGNYYFFCAVFAYLRRDLNQTSEYFELMDTYMPEGSLFQTMGRNRYQGYDAFDDLLSHFFNLHEAEPLLLKWIVAWEHKPEYPFIGFLSVSYSNLLYEWDRLEEAEHAIHQVLGRKDMLPFARVLIQIALSASRIELVRGNPERAMERIEQLKLQIRSPDYDLFMARIEAEQAYVYLQMGLTEEALSWLRRCGLAPTDEFAVNRLAEYRVMARVLAMTGRMEEALVLLNRIYRMLVKEERQRDQIQVLILQSVTHQRLGHLEIALTHLESALHLAEPQGYVRSFMDEGPIMADLLNALLGWRKGKANSASSTASIVYIEQLLDKCSPRSSKPPRERLTEREILILRLIGNGKSNREMAQQLNIAGETVKSHIKNLYRKLHVTNRVQAVQLGYELDLVQIDNTSVGS